MNDIVIIDTEALNEVKAFIKEKFPTMLQYFLEDSEGYITATREGIAASISEKIILPMHTLKASAKQMGALRLSFIAKVMEEKAREQVNSNKNDIEPFKELLTNLETVFAETKAAYQQYSA